MYSGFKYIAAMTSIAEQRAIQQQILKDFVKNSSAGSVSILDVGAGDGYELETLLESEVVKDCIKRIVALDIEDWLLPNLSQLPNAQKIEKKIEFLLGRAESLDTCFSNVTFDIVNCGFLFHELGYGEAKDLAMSACCKVLAPGGIIIYADAFLDNKPSPDFETDRVRQANVGALYQQYMSEVEDAQRAGRLSEQNRLTLLGDGNSPGLILSKAQAVNGNDDYYEQLGTCIDRFLKHGFINLRLYPNLRNQWLYIVVGEKAGRGREFV